MKEPLYQVIGYRVNKRTGERTDDETTILCPGPFTHKESMTAISKFTKRSDFAITIREVEES